MLKSLFAKSLTEEDQRGLIKTYVDFFREVPGVDKIYLIGSAARKEMKESSDLDFLIVFKSKEKIAQGRKIIRSKKFPTAWPTDVIMVDKDTFDRKSNMGGVCMIAKEDGVIC